MESVNNSSGGENMKMTLNQLIDKRNDLSRKLMLVGSCALVSGNENFMNRHNELLKEYTEIDRKILEEDYDS